MKKVTKCLVVLYFCFNFATENNEKTFFNSIITQNVKRL